MSTELGWSTSRRSLFARLSPNHRTKLTLQALEAYGIFKLGEIVGRRNLVGYKLKE